MGARTAAFVNSDSWRLDLYEFSKIIGPFVFLSDGYERNPFMHVIEYKYPKNIFEVSVRCDRCVSIGLMLVHSWSANKFDKWYWGNHTLNI